MKHLDFADKYRDYETSPIVFVTTNTHNKIPIFWDVRKARIVYDTLKFLVDRGDLKLYAWVIMPNHLHLLFEAINGKNYSEVMHSLKSYSSNEIKKATLGEASSLTNLQKSSRPLGEASCLTYIHNKRPCEAGSLAYRLGGARQTGRTWTPDMPVWQKSFLVRLPQKPESFGHFYDYIHFNPVKHNLVNDSKDWKWSSYREACKKGYYDI